ncbi:MAG: hypothetical protein PHF67_03250 [Candidatus Nanoarchaeia archaeon]|nr:hypothetical protein [Candidatus Nanoarchaeia archaeon]
MEIKLILQRGMKELDEKEKVIFDKLSSEYSLKIERMLKTVNLVEVLIKDYSKGSKFINKVNEEKGKSKKYSVHVKVFSSTRNFDGESSDWDFARTLHKSFIKVLNEIEHEFHVSDKGNEFRKSQNRIKRI